MRYDIEDFGDHILYGYYTKDEKGLSSGENWIKADELSETIIIGGYVYTWCLFYRDSTASDYRLQKVFDADLIHLSTLYSIASNENKHWVAFAIFEYIKKVAKYGILLNPNQLFFINRKDIRIDENNNVYDLIIDDYKERGYPITIDAPSEVLRVFHYNDELFKTYYFKCQGQGLDEIAKIFDNAKELAIFKGWKKAIFDFFVWPKLKVDKTEHDKYKKQFDRAIIHKH